MANPQPPKGMPSAPFSSSHSRVNSERTLSDSGGAPPASTTMTRVAAEGAPNPQFNEPEPSKPPLADSRRQRRKNRKPSGYLKIQHEGLSVNHIPSALSAGDLEKFKSDFHIPPEIELFLPGPNDSAHHSDDGKIAIYEDFLHSGLRFPLPDLLISLLKHFRLGLGQLNPNSIRMIVGFLFLCKACDITPSVNLFRRFFTLRINGKEPGWFCFAKRPTAATLIFGTPSSNHGWKPRYFFARSDQTHSLPSWRPPESAVDSDKPPSHLCAIDGLS